MRCLFLSFGLILIAQPLLILRLLEQTGVPDLPLAWMFFASMESAFS